MSYDLNFWKYADERLSSNHQEVYELLSDGQFVEGLLEIPVEAIVTRINQVFMASGWSTVDETSWEGEIGAFQLLTTPQFISVDCYGMDRDGINRIIEIASEFKLPLYDPQLGKRFDGGVS